MASTTTTWTSQILSEALGAVLPAHLPKTVVAPLCSQDSIAGLPTLTREYPVYSDLGAATSGSEGSDFSSFTDLSMGTAVSVTPTEGAIAGSQITTRAMRRRSPGASGDAFYNAFMSGNLGAVVSLLAPDAARLRSMVIEKAEDDVCGLLSGFSNTVGSTGIDVTVTNLIAAQYTLKTLEPVHEDWAYVLTPNQVQEIRLEIGATSGGLGGSVWFQQGDLNFFNIRPDLPKNGFIGSFMGLPIYEYAHSLRTLANGSADVAGALMCVGTGNPMDIGSKPGAIVFCEGEPMRFALDYDPSARLGELICVWEYAAAELDNNNAVSVITDAP